MTLMTAFLITLILYYPVTFGLGLWLRHETPFDQPADAAIVMGSIPRKALPRMQKAAQLYHLGLVKKLILTGQPQVEGLTEARWLRQKALEMGIDEADLILEEQATNSKENMMYCKPIIEQNRFRSVIIIQQEFSQIRGHLTAKKAFAPLPVHLISQPASSAPYWNPSTWMFHRIGWRYTWMTVSRLVKYRLKGDL